jgi:hypothetical protein
MEICLETLAMRFKGFGSIGKEDGGWEREGSEPYKWIVSCKRIEKEKGAAAIGTWGRRRRGRMTTMVSTPPHDERELTQCGRPPVQLQLRLVWPLKAKREWDRRDLF